MRERLVTLACALGAFALFYVMFVGTGREADPSREIARPTSVERRGNGYFAASEWLARAGIRVVSLRQRLSALAGSDLALAPRGNLLVITLPGVQGFRTEELLPLDAWIRAGNTLLVLAALGDRPDWAFASGALSTDDLTALTGLSFETAEAYERRRRGESAVDEQEEGRDGDALAAARRMMQMFGEPRATLLVPTRAHAYFEEVRAAAALSDYPSVSWVARVPYDTFFLALARRSDTGDDVLWTRRLGAGRIVVAAVGSLFTNRALARAGNARLLANIVAVNVAPDGAVIFDDMRQGLSAGYDPAQFFADRRLYATIAILLGLWLVWVLGGTRLRTPRSTLTVPRETDLLQSIGGFLARTLTPAAAAQRMFEHFFNGIRARTGRPPDGQATWDWLERHPGVRPADLERLKARYADAHGGRRVPLVSLHNLLLDIDRSIT